MTYARLTETPLDPGAIMAHVSSVARGATVLFVGSVRELNEGRPVTGLDYSAYVPMADAELSAIVREATAQWPAATIACEHRIGALSLGDLAVVVAAAHPHRGEAFAACRFVIEALKHRVPIWKREHYADGPAAWVEVQR